jgi:hypothetical protein
MPRLIGISAPLYGKPHQERIKTLDHADGIGIGVIGSQKR